MLLLEVDLGCHLVTRIVEWLDIGLEMLFLNLALKRWGMDHLGEYEASMVLGLSMLRQFWP